MLRPRQYLGMLLVLAAQAALGGEPVSGDALKAQGRVRIDTADWHQADGILAEKRGGVSGEVVRRDGLTLTVRGPDGRETRYPARNARIVGRLTALETAWLTIDPDDGGPEIRVPRGAIRRLEAFRGVRSRAGEGLVIGAVVPGIPLGFLGLLAGANYDCESDCNKNYIVFPVVGVAIGAGLGALVGNTFRTEQWERVSVGIALQPGRGGGASAALSLRF